MRAFLFRDRLKALGCGSGQSGAGPEHLKYLELFVENGATRSVRPDRGRREDPDVPSDQPGRHCGEQTPASQANHTSTPQAMTRTDLRDMHSSGRVHENIDAVARPR